MIKMMFGAAAVTMAMAGAASAQSGGAMAKGDKMGPGAKMTPVSYTGCIEAASGASPFALTHIAAVDSMGKMAMGKDAMGKDAMAKGASSKDAMAKDTMAKDAMGKDAMAKGPMMPSMLTLTTTSVDLAAHVGHKVSVTGTSDGHTFTASVVKMLATTCP
jgi:pentapeptide MXKDX repeat protein